MHSRVEMLCEAAEQLLPHLVERVQHGVVRDGVARHAPLTHAREEREHLTPAARLRAGGEEHVVVHRVDGEELGDRSGAAGRAAALLRGEEKEERKGDEKEEGSGREVRKRGGAEERRRGGEDVLHLRREERRHWMSVVAVARGAAASIVGRLLHALAELEVGLRGGWGRSEGEVAVVSVEQGWKGRADARVDRAGGGGGGGGGCW